MEILVQLSFFFRKRCKSLISPAEYKTVGIILKYTLVYDYMNNYLGYRIWFTNKTI